MVDRSVQYPGRYLLTPDPSAGANVFYITASPGAVYAAGTLTNRAFFLALAPMQYFDTVVLTSAWQLDSKYAGLGFGYRATIALAAATTALIPHVTLSISDAIRGGISPISETYNGGVYIYAKRIPSTTIIIPTIELERPTSAI